MRHITAAEHQRRKAVRAATRAASRKGRRGDAQAARRAIVNARHYAAA